MNPFRKQLGFALPLVILIPVILIAAGGVGYYFYKTSVDETADWETYRDEQNEWYEVKYPPNWTVRSSTVGLGSMVTFYDLGDPVFKIWARKRTEANDRAPTNRD
ncbi:hypothetical protein COY23_02190 [bacterium (Candidatus Torokbacteria) CG_4_10_14_0_2_um_filter_35_8]|nr:MAG: hypothetical protein COY23_02190 [bacterium (Candidatus Torokbacteria) CG_4_10_14_0_2_um_filter_35_8]